MVRSVWFKAALVVGSVLPLACSGGSLEPLGRSQHQVVYGQDGRRDYFELSDASLQQLMTTSSVALIANEWLDMATGRPLVGAPIWGEELGMCAGEPYEGQPAVAFCSGVLVDWDLVLTSGHCLRLYALSEFSIVFDHSLDDPSTLRSSAADVFAPVEIVAERLDPVGASPRLDYAFVRLDRAAAPPRAPAVVQEPSPPLVTGAALVTIGADSGLPLKLDASGTVTDARNGSDYFVANTDTSHGSSGGPVFDEQLALVGVLARGGEDYVLSETGCLATRRQTEDAAEEEYTYALRAIEQLCQDNPSSGALCAQQCGEDCAAVESQPTESAAGCGLLSPRAQPATICVVVVSLLLLGARRRIGWMEAKSIRKKT